MLNIDIVYLVVVLIAILISMTLHEAMHAFMGYWLGDDTAKLQGRLTFNPIPHIDPVTTVLLPLVLVFLGAPPFGAAKPVPFNPLRLRFGDFGAGLVGLAGPLTNLVLAIIAGLLIRIAGALIGGYGIAVLGVFSLVNVSFFVFNMIPFPPLDGSRVLYAFAPDAVRNLMDRIEAMGFIAIMLFMVLFYAILLDPFVKIVGLLSKFLIG